MIRPKNPAHSSSSSLADSIRARKWPLIAGAVFVIGLMVGVTYAAVPGVSHAIDEIQWSDIVNTTSPGAVAMITAINTASGSAAGKTTGINADSLDGQDSTAFAAQGGGGGSGKIYYNRCAWMGGATYTGTNLPQPQLNFYKTQCEDTSGNVLPPPNNQPAACAAGYTDLGVHCYASGINLFSPSPVESDTAPLGGATCGGPNSCETATIFNYPNQAGGASVAPVVITTVGVCERICSG